MYQKCPHLRIVKPPSDKFQFGHLHLSVNSKNTCLTSLTLLEQDFRQQKNQLLPIQRSRPSRDSQEPKTTKKIQFSPWPFLENPLFVLFPGKILDWGFSKKAIARIEIFWLFQVTMNISKAWNAKFEAASFFARCVSELTIARFG